MDGEIVFKEEKIETVSDVLRYIEDVYSSDDPYAFEIFEKGYL